MARARNLKPGFFRNADLVELPFEARIMFAGLWTLADRAGRLEDRPKQIKMELFPADNLDCNEILNSLASAGMIERYSVGCKSYIQVTNFTKHQNPHRDEKHSVIPCNPSSCIDSTSIEEDANTVQAQCKEDANTMAIGLTPSLLTPDSLNLIPESKPSAEYSAEFEQAWANYPPRSGASKKDSYRAWCARIKSGASAISMIEGAERYATYCKSLGTEDRFIKQPTTFFGKGEHYLSNWTPDPPKAQTGSSRTQDARAKVAEQIWGNKNGNDRQIIDITPNLTKKDTKLIHTNP